MLQNAMSELLQEDKGGAMEKQKVRPPHAILAFLLPRAARRAFHRPVAAVSTRCTCRAHAVAAVHAHAGGLAATAGMRLALTLARASPFMAVQMMMQMIMMMNQ